MSSETSRYRRRSPVEMLIRAQREAPGRPLLASEDGRASVGEFVDLARRCAVDLVELLGVGEGDRVAIVARNSTHRLAWQYGAYWIGAVEVSVNYELKGGMLRHIIEDSDPKVILVDAEILSDVAEIAGKIPLQVLAAPVTLGEHVDAPALDTAEQRLPAGSLATILYTSGTTGPSKGVMLPRGYLANHADTFRDMLGIRGGDVGYFVLPFFHVDAHILLPAVIEAGASIYFRDRFSVRAYWKDITTHGCAWTLAVGSMLSAVATAVPPAASDVRLRCVVCAPVPDEAYELFEDRLGIPVISLYGQTEADSIAFDSPDVRRRGSAGSPCEAFEVAILDADGFRLPSGKVGEICHRPNVPNMTMSGYWKRPDATVSSWRDLWYHTGDLGMLDEDGYLFFKGRMTDSLRYRGENISAYELESVLREAPGVDDIAAIGIVDALGGEDEIKVLVACSEDASFEAAAFFEFCQKNLPRFAVPRFVEQVSASEFVRSPGTGVIQKHRLSRSVCGPAVFDRRLVRG
ncbi:class I adenylate-forming enzyme family protein [Streptomyces antnestii]|uniref:class I adenylate-forming enzyme family protein n=1 Tax=Streptomyces antnestii TaxID=2494256 RepID=UPI001677B705|nr:AMP-binding protein [Streptomyces sp. San01]